MHLYAKPLLVLFRWYLVKMNRPSSVYLSGSLGHRIYYLNLVIVHGSYLACRALIHSDVPVA